MFIDDCLLLSLRHCVLRLFYFWAKKKLFISNHLWNCRPAISLDKKPPWFAYLLWDSRRGHFSSVHLHSEDVQNRRTLYLCKLWH